ncbi:hypothetical protein DL546_000761 [Coniochaeta pulveracea]|uniref:Uncharacterized protein n=1 Tax=Coniochaeta pulveracea TaxID=177199 RepID=A0A420Y518_9PEZI|nr:hypothetical protein DL546_000761 [Coniochaeta pulveracea]
MASLTQQLQFLLWLVMLMMLTPVLCAGDGTPSLAASQSRQFKHWQFDENRLLYPDTTTTTRWPDYTSTTSTWMAMPDITGTVTRTDLRVNTHDICKVSAPTVTLTPSGTTRTVTVTEKPFVASTVTISGPDTTVRPTITYATRSMTTIIAVTEHPTAYIQMAVPPPSTVTVPPPPPVTVTLAPAPVTVTLAPPLPITVTLPPPPPSTVTVSPPDVFTHGPYTPWVPHVVGHSFHGHRSKDFKTKGIDYPEFPMYTAVNPVDPPARAPINTWLGKSYINMYEPLKKRGGDPAYVPTLSADENMVIWNIAGPTPVLYEPPTTTVVESRSSDLTREFTFLLPTTTMTDVKATPAPTTTARPALSKRFSRYTGAKWWTVFSGTAVSGGSFPTEYPSRRPVAWGAQPTTFKTLHTRN